MKTKISKYNSFPELEIDGDLNQKVMFPILLTTKDDQTKENLSVALNKEGIKELIVILTKLL